MLFAAKRPGVFFGMGGGGFKKKGSPYPVLNFFVFNTVLAESLLFAAVI